MILTTLLDDLKIIEKIFSLVTFQALCFCKSMRIIPTIRPESKARKKKYLLNSSCEIQTNNFSECFLPDKS